MLYLTDEWAHQKPKKCSSNAAHPLQKTKEKRVVPKAAPVAPKAKAKPGAKAAAAAPTAAGSGSASGK